MSKDKNQQIYTQAWAWVIKKVSVVVRWYTITVKKRYVGIPLFLRH